MYKKRKIITMWVAFSFTTLFVNIDNIPLWAVVLLVVNFAFSVLVAKKTFNWN